MAAIASLHFVQLGYSLATALSTWLGRGNRARETLSGLGSDIEGLLRHVEELEKLLKANDETKGWNRNGVHEAQKCMFRAESLIKKTLVLLRKARANLPVVDILEPQDVTREALEVISWSRFSGRAREIKRELQLIRTSVLLFCDLHVAKAG
jgi:hypothetical protein